MPNFFPAIQALNDGTVIAYPTESVYGLGCDPFNQFAVLHLLALKKRATHKGLILIAANVEQIMPYITPISPDRMQQILNTWPGPFTWVFPKSKLTPAWIHGNHNTVAVRITAHPIARDLCTHFGKPLISTSANVEGELPARTAKAVEEMFPTGIKMIVFGETGGLSKPTEIRDAVSGIVIR